MPPKKQTTDSEDSTLKDILTELAEIKAKLGRIESMETKLDNLQTQLAEISAENKKLKEENTKLRTSHQQQTATIDELRTSLTGWSDINDPGASVSATSHLTMRKSGTLSSP